jgi:hypothetical protein
LDNYALKQRWTISAGLAIVCLYVAYSVFVIFFTEFWPADHLTRLYNLALILLSIIFFERENRKYEYIYHPHEFGMFAWLFWPFFVPYYLVKTRGAIGALIFVVLIALLIVQSLIVMVWDALPV